MPPAVMGTALSVGTPEVPEVIALGSLDAGRGTTTMTPEGENTSRLSRSSTTECDARPVVPDTAAGALFRWVPAAAAGNSRSLVAHSGDRICLKSHLADIPTSPGLVALSSGSGVLWIPLVSFSADPRVVRQGLETFSEIDIPDRLPTSPGLRRGVDDRPGNGSRHSPSEKSAAVCRTRPEPLPDEHSTIGNHFEVAKSPTVLADRVEAELTVSRTLRMESVLVAGHRELTGARADRFRAAAETAEEMRNSSPLQVRIQGDGFAEDAVGSGVLFADRVGWSLNGLLNEGAVGVRLGVGNGPTCMRFDLISREARLDTLWHVLRHADDPPSGFPAPPPGAGLRRPCDRRHRLHRPAGLSAYGRLESS